jgi:GntR family transcriptional regulator
MPPRLAATLSVELRKMINVDLKPGDRFPSEKEMAQNFGVSRNTVREALLSLWDEGLVVRKWGVGTFVRDSGQPITQSISTVVPMNEFIGTTDKEITLSEVSVERVPCPEDAAVALSLTPGTEVWHIDRTFSFNGTPALILQDWLPTIINVRHIDPTSLKDGTAGLLDLLRDTARCKITRMEAQFFAIAANDEVAGRFGTPIGTPLVSVEQVSVDNAGEIVIFSRNLYNTEVSRLHLVRSRRFS